MQLNNLTLEEQSKLPIEEFIKLPTTVDFTVYKNQKLMDYIKDKEYVKLGRRLSTGYVIAYTNNQKVDQIFRDLGYDFLHFYPFYLTTLDKNCNNKSNITPLHELPNTSLKGQDVIIGFVDTGIDYAKDIFKFNDGKTKINYIWDQTIEGDGKNDYYFGTVYSKDEINKAINSTNPLEIVPSIDEIGHGTFLASVACANDNDNVTGSAPMSEIIMVKLKEIDEFYLRKYNLLEQDEPLPDDITNKNIYSSNNVMLGIDFIINKANELGKPVVICVGVGGNYGYHNGSTLIEEYISEQCYNTGVVIITAAGNEREAAHHTQGELQNSGDTQKLSINVENNTTTFFCFIWCNSYDRISVSIKSPNGEILDRVPIRIGTTYNKLVFENSLIAVSYFTGEQNLIIVTIRASTLGVWEIFLHGEYIISGQYDAWLQISGAISPFVNFRKPIPYKTIVIPATAIRSITCGGYNCQDGSLYSKSSWGPTNALRFSPDFVAPGVDVFGMYPSGVGTMSGTSVSAAITSGAAALLLQWGIVLGNDLTLDCDKVRALLISGCTRDPNINYPSEQWGFGKLNLLNTFELLG